MESDPMTRRDWFVAIVLLLAIIGVIVVAVIRS